MIARHLGAIAGLAMLAHPAGAAEPSGTASTLARPAAFAGFTLRLPLGRQEPARPEARMQLTTYRTSSSNPGRLRSPDPNGLELGISKAGKPLLFAGGQDIGQARHRLGLDTGTTLLVVGGVVAAVVLVAVAAGGAGMGDTCPEYEGSRDHCINP